MVPAFPGSLPRTKSKRYQTAAPKAHHLVPLFTNTISAFMHERDPVTVRTHDAEPSMSNGYELLKSVTGYDFHTDEDATFAFAIAVKDAVSMDEDTLFLQTRTENVTSSYPAEITSLITIFAEQNLEMENVINGLKKFEEDGGAKTFIAIKADAGVYRQYRLTEIAGNILIESVITPSAELSPAYDEIIYEKISIVPNLSFVKIKCFPFLK